MKKVVCSIDPVVFTLIDHRLHVLLPARTHAPFKDARALPGGVLDDASDSSLDAGASRILCEKTGVQAFYFEQLGAFGPHDDPRGATVVVAYMAVLGQADALMAPRHAWVGVEDALKMKLPFAHNRILAQALLRLRNKVNYSSLPAYLLPEEFTLPELQKAYEDVLGVKMDKSAFRKKIMEAQVVVEMPGRRRLTGASRPAQLYRRAADELHHFAANLSR